MVGQETDAAGIVHGFLLEDGSFSNIDFPNSIFNLPAAINNRGEIVGFYQNADTNIHGYLLKDGNFTTIDDPEAAVFTGADLADKIETLAETGHIAVLDEIQQRTPPGLLVLLDIPGLGPKRAKLLNEAYAVLSDPQKREHYDRFGTVEAPFGAGGFGGFAGAGMGDIFDFFFGGGGRRAPGPVRGSDLRYDLEVDLRDVLEGCRREISFSHLARCETCKGTGSADQSDPVACPDCQGTGELHHTRNTLLGQFVTTAPCARCGGTGRIVRDPCKACRGSGRSEQRKKLTVEVPAGADNGTRLRYSAMGEAGERGGPSGDLYVYLAVAPNEVFARQGADLHCETAISFTQAALGATLQIEGLDGAVTLKIPPGTQTGTTFRIGGRGVPKLRGRGRGDLVVDVRVAVPSKLTRKQREILEEFARAGGEEIEDRDAGERIRKVFGD
jgi:molecular chaperone DnaJ